MDHKPKIALLGLGLMGGGMAARLLSQGFPVTVYNRTAARAEALRANGAAVGKTPRQAAEGAAFIVSMVADDASAHAVWLGPDGALAGAARGAILIESSTVTVDWINELSAGARENGCDVLDAPVTGSKSAAAAGELFFLVGGAPETLARAQPILRAMSRDLVHLGPSGCGALMKLINNFVCGVQAVALAEALAIVDASDLDRDKAVAVLTGGAPGGPLVKLLSARMVNRNYDPQFRMRLMAKDLRYAIKQFVAKTSMDVVAAALRTLDRAIEAGHGEEDFSAVVELLRGR